MRILLVSNSARGHAIAEALARSKHKPEIIAAVTSSTLGMSRIAKEVHVVEMMSFSHIVDLARRSTVDFAFIAPDDPIGGGLADRLEASGIPCVAPKKNLARIESSKGFARELMHKYHIDMSPKFRTFSFTSPDKKRELDISIRNYIEHELHGHYVVKYDALKGGKGVKVSGEHLMSVDAGARYAMECIDECGTVVVEEKLEGVEFSLMSFVSGTQVIDMPAVQDHKRAFAGDTGSNTGGMGTYSDANHSLPFLTPADLASASTCNRLVAEALHKECGEPFKGILYGGFMAVADGVRVIEYNARFGDPEALNVLPILESDFVDICLGIIHGTLTKDLVRFAPKATVCKYVTPKSYPNAKKEKGDFVFLPEVLPENVRVYEGDVGQDTNGNITLGTSRSLGIVGIAESLSDAEQVAQSVCEQITGPVRFRHDIATADALQKRIDVMHAIRRS